MLFRIKYASIDLIRDGGIVGVKKIIFLLLIIVIIIADLKVNKTLDMGFLGYIIGATIGFILGTKVKK